MLFIKYTNVAQELLVIISIHSLGPEHNKIVGVLNNVDWKKLARQLGLEKEINDIHGACQNHLHPVPCWSGEVLQRFKNRQGLESCCVTVTKIAGALDLLNHELAAEELINKICTPEGEFSHSAITLLCAVTAVFL